MFAAVSDFSFDIDRDRMENGDVNINEMPDVIPTVNKGRVRDFRAVLQDHVSYMSMKKSKRRSVKIHR